jgi:hypothetical protein
MGLKGPYTIYDIVLLFFKHTFENKVKMLKKVLCAEGALYL